MFGKRKKPEQNWDRERKTPVLKCSICNGEQVAGFLDKETKELEEVALIRNEKELAAFREAYGITEKIKKIY